MKIFLDTADITEIGSAYDTGILNGVTTNPTLIRRSGRNPVEVIKEISTTFPLLESISAEVVADTAEEMVEQAEEFKDLENVTIKVPCTIEGLKACKTLSDSGFAVNVTLVFSVSQAILAAKAGAQYVSPFVGRWIDQGVDGISLVKNIQKVFKEYFFPTLVLSASIRDVSQVEASALVGADIVTIPSKVFWSMYNNVLTDKGLEQFQKDWEAVNNV